MRYPALPAALIAAGLSVSAPAQADNPSAERTDVPKSASDARPAVPIAPVATSLPRDRKSPMLSDAELDTQRGGETIIVTTQILNAITSGNVLGDYSAGDVALSDFALSNFNGVGNLLINTGAQVSLQSGMNLTINVGN